MLLKAWAAGDSGAGNRLFDRVYPELRRLARRQLARDRARTCLQATDVVHEAYLRLMDQRQCDWSCRDQFFAVAATVIRRILLDHAKHRTRHKRGRGADHIAIDEASPFGFEPNLDFLALDRALVELAGIQMTAARIVELRYFAGLSLDETGQALGLSRSTVQRKWRFAKGWLARKLGGDR